MWHDCRPRSAAEFGTHAPFTGGRCLFYGALPEAHRGNMPSEFQEDRAREKRAVELIDSVDHGRVAT